MDFSQDELHQSVAEAARAFARGEVSRTAGDALVPKEIWTQLAELGLLGICVPEEQEGSDLDALALFACVEELARVSGAVAWGVVLAAEACAALPADDPGVTRWMDGSLLAEASALEAAGPASLGLRALGRGLELERPTAATGARKRAALTLRQVGAAAALVGLADAATDAALAYAKERKQFGRALAAFQAIQFKLADARTQVGAARLLGHRAAMEGTDAAAASALAFAARIAPEVCSESLQIHGGYGYTRDFPVERMLRDATALKLLARDRVALSDAVVAELLAS